MPLADCRSKTALHQPLRPRLLHQRRLRTNNPSPPTTSLLTPALASCSSISVPNNPSTPPTLLLTLESIISMVEARNNYDISWIISMVEVQVYATIREAVSITKYTL